jgi:hypothetical protein
MCERAVRCAFVLPDRRSSALREIAASSGRGRLDATLLATHTDIGLLRRG